MSQEFPCTFAWFCRESAARPVWPAICLLFGPRSKEISILLYPLLISSFFSRWKHVGKRKKERKKVTHTHTHTSFVLPAKTNLIFSLTLSRYRSRESSRRCSISCSLFSFSLNSRDRIWLWNTRIHRSFQPRGILSPLSLPRFPESESNFGFTSRRARVKFNFERTVPSIARFWQHEVLIIVSIVLLTKLFLFSLFFLFSFFFFFFDEDASASLELNYIRVIELGSFT